MIESVLKFFKIDIGITHNKRDEYFLMFIKGCEKELSEKSIQLNKENAEDIKLLTDYSIWSYKKRQEDIPLSKNLQLRIRNRIVNERANKNGN